MSIRAFMEADHQRLDDLLEQATAGDDLDLQAYARFRAGLLKHIAMEEKVLFPATRKVGGEPVPLSERLRADHGKIAALLVPSPTRAIAAKLRSLLVEHNRLEEADGGVYAICERRLGDQAATTLDRLEAMPDVKVAPHCDLAAR